jgi:PrcB C-terminal
VRVGTETVPRTNEHVPRRRLLSYGILTAGLLVPATGVFAQTVDVRHWHGVTAITRQPEQVVATTTTEWRSLWGRVGSPAPDVFEPGRMNAVGIFLGRRNGEGYSVNVLSTSRRRDRIVVVFEERMPAEIMMAQRSPAPPSAPRPVASAPGGFAGGAGFAPSGSGATLAPPPPAPARPVGPPTSPWAIILIPRADLPVSVEQRLFR